MDCYQHNNGFRGYRNPLSRLSMKYRLKLLVHKQFEADTRPKVVTGTHDGWWAHYDPCTTFLSNNKPYNRQILSLSDDEISCLRFAESSFC